MRHFFCWILLFVGLVWGICALFDWGGQRKAIYLEGREELYDFWMPMDCVRGGYGRADGIKLSGWILPEDLARGVTKTETWRPGAVFKTGWVDRVYPAFALLPFKAIPLTRTAGWCWSIGAGVVFLLSLVCCARGKLWPVAFICSSPFIYNLERGNPVWLSAAAVAVFLAWWDDEEKWKRVTAAVCLSVASAMKLAPAVLGLLYLRNGFSSEGKKFLAMAVLACLLTVVFLVVPWVWMPDGFAGVGEFVRNAKYHSESVLRAADFGLVQVWRSVRMVFGRDVTAPWPGMMVVARLSQGAGLVALLVGARRRDLLLLVGGMLLAAGNMYYYAALYLLPVFVLEWRSRGTGESEAGESALKGLSVLELLLWFALCCPLQLIVLGHAGNGVICNVAVMCLMMLRMWAGSNPAQRVET